MASFDFKEFCDKCDNWCCKGENPYASKKELEVLKVKGIKSKRDGSCIFLKDKLCSNYNNRPFECRIFPFDIQKIDNELWWVLWDVCPAHTFVNPKEFIEEFETEFSKTWSLEYVKDYVNFHKSKEPIKYDKFKFKKIKRVVWKTKKSVLLVYAPFCSPASPPYSLTNLHAFLKNNLLKGFTSDVLDLNLSFHKRRFGGFQTYFKNMLEKFDSTNYDLVFSEYRKVTSEVYIKNNKCVVNSENPEFFNELLQEIVEKKPDLVAFSIVYSSQCFYALALIKELKNLGIKSVVGGPAVNSKLRDVAYNTLNNELDLLEFIINDDTDHDSLNFNSILDFSIWNLNDYFTPVPVIPLKTCNTCFYQQCAFCTHHSRQRYFEFSLDNIRDSIIKSKVKNVFFVDDMISKTRLLEIAKVVKPLNISWTCQLRPTSDLDEETLKVLRDSGLRMVLWGVESGCDRVLKLINKGTNKADVQVVLTNSHSVGIRNVIFIIFGFPSETKEEFLETIDFLKNNSGSIDLALTSIFGLQRGSPVYKNPKKFGIKKIIEKERTVLEPSIDYEVSVGLSNAQASRLRQNYKKTLDKLNKFPKGMNFFREHMLTLIGKN